MAKRSYSRKGSKIQPSMLTLSFAGPTVSPGGGVYSHVDLSQVASLVNRRFYRQGINWAVAGFKIFTQTGYEGTISVSKLPNTWTLSNSWEKSFRAWNKMNREALAEAESTRPKFLDFKVYANARHHAAGFAANLLPISSDGTYAAGEWEASEIYTPNGPNFPGNTTNFELVAVGPNFPGVGASGLDAVSLIEGYAASRALPNIADPNVPDDMQDADGSTPENWLSAMFNEGTDQSSEVLEDMRTKNNIAPYPFENDGTAIDTQYPGGANQGTGLEIHDNMNVQTTTIGGNTYLKGGNFPCGLIEFLFTNSGTPGAVGIQIDLVPGDHRGYLCEPMTEM